MNLKIHQNAWSQSYVELCVKIRRMTHKDIAQWSQFQELSKFLSGLSPQKNLLSPPIVIDQSVRVGSFFGCCKSFHKTAREINKPGSNEDQFFNKLTQSASMRKFRNTTVC